MFAHLRYAAYIFKHKRYVYEAGRQLGLGRWQLLIHDLSKLRPSEWSPYVDYFYRREGKAKHRSSGGFYVHGQNESFDKGWLLHIHRNPHHHQFWLLRQDNGELKALPMPDRYVREMIADWIGAGKVQGNGDDVGEWYARNKEKIVLHPWTRSRVEYLLHVRQYGSGVGGVVT